jgi:hypothetical protein
VSAREIRGCSVRDEARFSDGSRLFFHFCPGIATWSACCVVDPLSPGNSGGSKGVSPREAPFSIFPRMGQATASGSEAALPFPSWLLAERPAHRLVGLDRVDNCLEFSFLLGAFRASL